MSDIGWVWVRGSITGDVVVYAFIARRVLLAGLSVIVISMLTYAVVELPPGDAITNYIHELEEGGGTLWTKETQNLSNDKMRQSEVDALRAYYGLDKPVYYRYAKWVWNMGHGEFGHTLMRAGTQRAPGMSKVTEVIKDRLTLTIILTAATTVFIFAVSFPIGI